MRNWACFCLLLSPLLLSEPASAGQRYALLIGVDNYSNLQPLNYCGNDARALGSCLAESGFSAFNIVCMEDRTPFQRLKPTKSNIEANLKAIVEGLNPDDLVLISFSGHGVFLEDKRGGAGKSYFCPIDAQVQRRESLIEVDWLFDALSRCRAKRKLLLVDACRNQVHPRGARAVNSQSDSTSFTRSLAESLESVSGGVSLITSCDKGQFAMEDPRLQQGVFSHFVRQGLLGHAPRSPDGSISLLNLFRYVNERTKSHVDKNFREEQTPTLKGEITGDFSLTDPLPTVLATAPLPMIQNSDDALRLLRGNWVCGKRRAVFGLLGKMQIITEEGFEYDFMMSIDLSGGPTKWRVEAVEAENRFQKHMAEYEWHDKDHFTWRGPLGELTYVRTP